ncbi:N-acetylmuramoyl-L-alanine amidase [uncultured Selenomonas sp.]|uniref:N-acetylmuramoyl-L-alanine amidase n=1 Tax=uncultured Selenomonas sp. TaxID=159275 RepID=UPI0028DB3134|nr:N-acetylmuramoyl-L-alanine amidase [uncultured Selenomonas sp.]
MHRIFLLFTVILVGLIGFGSAVTAEAAFSDRAKDMTKVSGVRIGKTDGNVRIVIDAERAVSYKQSVLSNPTRVVLDVQNAWVAPEAKKDITIDSPLVSRVRVAQFDAATVRVVVETSVKKGGWKIFALDGEKPRIVMDFGAAPTGTNQAKPAQEAKKPAPPVQTDETEEDDEEDVQSPHDSDQLDRDLSAITGMKGRRIAIDPGHGGSDSGAIGPTGIMEKSVTMRVSRELKRLLEAEGATVILTRTGDTEVSEKGASATSVEELQARCDVANQAKADIFLSIHADAFTNREVKGTTAYYYAQGTKQSKQLADSVRTALIDAIGTVDRGTQSCNFYVVKHTDMPAILVEISFISNPDEEKMMNSETGIKKIAQGIADGIADYFG